MFTVSRTLDVNDPRSDRAPLTRSQLWQGLVMKAEDAVPFVGAMARCTVVDRGDDWLVRDILLRGEEMRERVTFEPERRVTFERVESSAMGTILNEILEGADGALQLRFTFSLEPEGIEPGSAEESAFAERMADSYLEAVNTTLATIRDLVGRGALAD